MAGIDVKRFESPDEERTFDHGRIEIVTVGGHEISRATFESGWCWSEHVKPIAETRSCEFAHLGHVLSGRLRVRMDDGTETELGPGDVFHIAPGHDAEVVGDEPCVMIDAGDEDADYAKPKAES